MVGGAAKGVFSAVANITSSLGAGLSSVLDKDYQQRRRQHLRGSVGEHRSGLSGIKAGVSGVVEGLSGLVLDPVRGAREGGVSGFVGGVGKGLLGVLVKSAVGVVDIAAGTFASLRNFAVAQRAVAQQRLPRFFPPDGRLLPYDPVSAEVSLE